jgi:ketosteroid isomerase-like protein
MQYSAYRAQHVNKRVKPMDLEQQFRDFAAAFEVAYATDDWSVIAPHFTDDASYTYSDGSDAAVGREAVLQKLQTAVNELDRRMDQRDLAFQGISVDGDTVTARWSGRYTKHGLPPLDVSGEEVARFSGGAINELTSVIDDDSIAAFGAWMEAHAGSL